MSAATGFRLLPLGVGDAFSARYYSSCVALEADGQWLLVDCPHPIRKILREASDGKLDVADISGVALTHLHADHSSGLEGIGFYSRFFQNRRMPLITHPLVSQFLWAGRLSDGMQWSLAAPQAQPEERRLDDFFELRLVAEHEPVTHGPFRIHSRLAIHSVPTTAFLIEAGGRTLGYSADTIFDPELIAWLSQADLVVHEASGGFMHTPYENLAALPAATRAKMRLIHYPDKFDVAASNIRPLEQGRFEAV